MGDYNFKSAKDYDKRDECVFVLSLYLGNRNNLTEIFIFLLKSMVLNYIIKDLTINKQRFDAWIELALFTSAKILTGFPEIVIF